MKGIRLLRQLYKETPCTLPVIRSFATASGKTNKTKTKKEKIEVKKVSRTTGYALYAKDASAKLKKLNLPIGELSKQVAKEWAAASDATRKKFNDEATRLNTDIAPKVATKKPVVKRPLSAYAQFTKSVFPTVKQQYSEKSFGELSKIISEMWKNLSEAEKESRKQALSPAT